MLLKHGNKADWAMGPMQNMIAPKTSIPALRVRCCLSIVVLLLTVLCRPTLAQYDGAPVRDGNRSFQKPVQNWIERRNRNILMQQRDFSCGAAILGTMMRYYWEDRVTEEILIEDLRQMLPQEELFERVENGLAITDLRRLAVRRGYLSTIGRVSFDQLTKSKIPLIVGIVTNGYDHFVLFRGFDGEWVYLADPSRGNIRVPSWQFVREWQENAVLIVIKKGGKPQLDSPLHVRDEERGVGRTNLQLIRNLPTGAIRAGFR
ncbi:MAG: cysteine peptidase family C39 domain-containing protein [Fuerstiella sp.]|nr:cysteine peptidase family C39 domain-containing protein [Fuerstiella sp.]